MNYVFTDYDIWKTIPDWSWEEEDAEEKAYSDALDSELLRLRTMPEYDEFVRCGWLMFEMQF